MLESKTEHPHRFKSFKVFFWSKCRVICSTCSTSLHRAGEHHCLPQRVHSVFCFSVETLCGGTRCMYMGRQWLSGGQLGDLAIEFFFITSARSGNGCAGLWRQFQFHNYTNKAFLIQLLLPLHKGKRFDDFPNSRCVKRNLQQSKTANVSRRVKGEFVLLTQHRIRPLAYAEKTRKKNYST